MSSKFVVRQGLDDIASLEKEFSLPQGFFDTLRNEDDWSVVIKCHALIEAATSRMLTLYFGKRSLAEVFERLELSNRSTGKAAFISKLRLLDSPLRSFIAQLSELRNQYVHNISKTCVSLSDLIEALSRDKRKGCLSSLNIRCASIQINGELVTGENLILKYPKLVIWSSTLVCLSDIWVQCVFAAKRHELIAEHLRTVKKPIMINSKSAILSLDSISD